jgi:hypothetical protein
MRRNLNRRIQPQNPTPLTISLDNPKVVREIPAYTLTISDINVEYFVDSPSEKIVEAYLENLGMIILWQGEAYDAIGDWTNADVEARIKELYS